MKITSTAFEDNQPMTEGRKIPLKTEGRKIPLKTEGRKIPLIFEQYTCDGQDINPPLRFEEIPTDAASLALIVSDPDAVNKKPFYHWVLFNMDIGIDHIDEDSTPATAIEGTNDFGNTEYGGPCPPSGTHRYVFTLYALDGPLNLEESATAKEVLEEMEGHMIETAQLTGKYTKK